ncbi:MAG: hypothetical protein WDO69_08655 [Pseudomonadota bacterium]
MTIPLKPASKSAAKVLNTLADGLDEPGQAKNVDNTGGAFMAVHVECIGRNEHGLVYSVGHYFEVRGDLVADPEMEILRDGTGAWLPMSISMALGGKRAVEFGESGTVRVDEREYRSQLRFLSTWMRNISAQQRF